jgi:membrane protease YdiL (CAAX protease family)
MAAERGSGPAGRARHNASAVGTTGSVPRDNTLPPALGIAVFALGVYSMRFPIDVAQAAAARGHAIGLRPLLMASELMLITPALLALALLRRPLAASLHLRAVDGGAALVALCAGAALWAASLGLLEVQSVLWPPSEAFLETFRELHRALRPRDAMDAAFSVLAIAVFPAVCEEILFRGVVLPSLARGLGGIGAVVASALMFGLIHLDLAGGVVAFTRIPFAILVGVGLGLLRVRSGSLVPPILGHAVLNTITFATVVLTGVDMETETPDAALGAALLLGGSVLTAIALRQAGPPAPPAVDRASLPAAGK